jgi:hypothetical protein
MTFIRPGRFEELVGIKRQSCADRGPCPVLTANSEPSAANESIAPERYDLRQWFDGWKIYDRGDLIATFHGPQLDLAGKLLRLLREDAA